ncbi:ABC transporter substrate-binding protein [Actinomadura sp. NBRC 104425]|uniref:transporter substrate-binding domain-containing protein n=1 Tax=Actinomadura sp. NBRC 104425 TaxID=3032204 RepID=UPI0024A56F0C|nr:transporter substrate-binding domain-containing protein [Actinomadura sp. NBRC 104425]GLZ13309.1 ABC transporter substrate-binding protein [Actinomadura sp. NBRC 104425]
MPYRPAVRLAAVAALPSLAAAACCHGASEPAPGPSLERLYAMDRALRVGIKADQPGIGLCNAAGSKCTGLDVDIAIEIAKALRVEPVFQPVVSGNRERLLQNRAVDLVIASYSISEARLKVIDFAGPYLISAQDTLVRSGDKSITEVDDLKDKITCGAKGSSSPLRLAIRFGDPRDTGSAWARRHLRLVDGFGDCLPLLLDGTVDAVSTDESILAGFAADSRYKGKVRLLHKPFSSHREKYGIGMRKGDPVDRALINRTLNEMIRDGRWARIVTKNLRPAAPHLLAPENRPTPPVE